MVYNGVVILLYSRACRRAIRKGTCMEIRNERIKTELQTADFYYDLPEEQIAQSPSEKRDMCRLMVVDRSSDKNEHKIFRDVIDYLRPEDIESHFYNIHIPR